MQGGGALGALQVLRRTDSPVHDSAQCPEKWDIDVSGKLNREPDNQLEESSVPIPYSPV